MYVAAFLSNLNVCFAGRVASLPVNRQPFTASRCKSERTAKAASRSSKSQQGPMRTPAAQCHYHRRRPSWALRPAFPSLPTQHFSFPLGPSTVFVVGRVSGLFVLRGSLACVTTQTHLLTHTCSNALEKLPAGSARPCFGCRRASFPTRTRCGAVLSGDGAAPPFAGMV
jgi:hypothetical protein